METQLLLDLILVSIRLLTWLKLILKLNFNFDSILVSTLSGGSEKLYNITEAVDQPRAAQESISWWNDIADDKRKTKTQNTKLNENTTTTIIIANMAHERTWRVKYNIGWK